MRRFAYKKYLLIGSALFLLLTLPVTYVETLRASTIRVLSIIFNGGRLFAKNKPLPEEKLEAENHLLRIEIGKMRAILEQKSKIEALQEETRHYALSAKRLEETKYLAGQANQALAARVIYRDTASWSSAFWVNVGEETNQILKLKVVQKNSPVLVGRSVVGAVDYVGKKQARIRLITDPSLKLSVRAVRGHPQNIALIEHLEPILRHLHAKHDPVGDEKAALIKYMERWKEQLSETIEGWYLAKGILQGGKRPRWRSLRHTLSGIGFNYDFADDEGPARELSTGKPLEGGEMIATAPIIQLNDLLVTTGMDGVFPPGLRVAEVTKVYPLREGAYTYEIEATPVVGNLDTLQTVFIIPPLGYEHEDRQN
jgi:rod shape-determining protein MreC